MKNFIKIFICLFFICNSIKGENNDIYFYHLSPRDGLSQMNILSIYQDELGAMWFGTTEGIDRYNGQSIEYFQPSSNENLRDNAIHSITGNKAGIIYTIAGKDLIKFDIHSYKFELLKNQIDAMTYFNGVLWIAKKDSLIQYDEKKDQFNLYTKLNRDVSTVLSICPTQNEGVWLGTSNGLVKINAKNPNKQTLIKENTSISRLYTDSKNNLWAASRSDGLYKLEPSGKITNFKSSRENSNSLSNDQVRDIVEDNSGNIWIATFYGLNKLDQNNAVWHQYLHDDNTSYSISHSSIFSLYKDIQGTIWIGTYFGGVNYFNQDADIFRYYGAKLSNPNYLSFPYVGNMVEDRYGNLWICTEGGALNCMNLATRQLSRYPLSNTQKSVNQKCIWYDKDHDLLYIGLYNEGLAIFNIKTKQFKLIGNNDDYKLLNLSKNTINQMQYYKGRLILMTPKGLISMDTHQEKFYPFSNNPKIQEALTKAKGLTFHIDKNDRMWLISNGLMCIDLKTNEIKEYQYEKGNEHTIGKCEINYIFETSTGDIYFSSLGSGIFRYNPLSDDFDNYTEEKDGLISDFCYSISEIPSGNLILLHNKGLSFFDPTSPKTNIFRSSLNFPIIGFNTGNAVYMTSNDEIFIGGINGLISFNDHNINKVNKDYRLYFDMLYINNQKVYPNDDTDVLDQALPLCDKITLQSNQTNFKIEFATNSYLQTMVHSYEYKLEGFDKDWIQSNERLISYTNLDPGEYVLQVQEVGNPKKRSVLKIEIIPPFYKSTLAFVLYFIALALVCYIILRFYLWRAKLQTSLEFESKEKQRIEELNHIKLRFFTNISHEFRTPLTLINGHVESLLIQSDINTTVRSKIDKIHKNTNHLQSLITELLDFRKQEQGFYKLKARQVELVGYTRAIYESFKEYAVFKNIKFRFDCTDDEIYVYIDPSYFRKAIYNLLSNAFKYTANGGEIRIRLKKSDSDNVFIEVVDNGIGIGEEHLDKIFERFYQLDYRSSQLSSGTGIGLAFTKEIVNGHKGTIGVSSIPNEGSVFTIVLKLGKNHFSEEELDSEGTLNSTIEDVSIANQVIEREKTLTLNSEGLVDDGSSENDKKTILVVDDNIEIVELLTNALSRFYNIHTAQNGKDAFNIIEREEPDLVISDVVMPEMSGKDLCFKIKNNVNTSHIPIILLTAQGDEEQIIGGYMFGADLYVTKPFNMKILLSQCNNIVRNRQLLYKKIADQKGVDLSFQVVAEDDQKLIDRAITIIKESLTDNEFDMNKLAADLGLGRSKLYAKIKYITGMTPNELTLNIKLKEAIYLLENSPQKNISEIAFSLGFSSTKYFSKCFKTFYGIAPQNWRKKEQ